MGSRGLTAVIGTDKDRAVCVEVDSHVLQASEVLYTKGLDEQVVSPPSRRSPYGPEASRCDLVSLVREHAARSQPSGCQPHSPFFLHETVVAVGGRRVVCR